MDECFRSLSTILESLVAFRDGFVDEDIGVRMFATGYEIWRGSGLSGTRTLIATVSGLGTTTWTDTTVAESSPYNYALRAVYGGWSSPDSGPVAQTTPKSANCA